MIRQQELWKSRVGIRFLKNPSSCDIGFSYDARSGGGGADSDGGGRRWSDDFNGFGARAFFQVRPSVTPARYVRVRSCQRAKYFAFPFPCLDCRFTAVRLWLHSQANMSIKDSHVLMSQKRIFTLASVTAGWTWRMWRRARRACTAAGSTSRPRPPGTRSSTSRSLVSA